jgi:hypothetical protein
MCNGGGGVAERVIKHKIVCFVLSKSYFCNFYKTHKSHTHKPKQSKKNSNSIIRAEHISVFAITLLYLFRFQPPHAGDVLVERALPSTDGDAADDTNATPSAFARGEVTPAAAAAAEVAEEDEEDTTLILPRVARTAVPWTRAYSFALASAFEKSTKCSKKIPGINNITTGYANARRMVPVLLMTAATTAGPIQEEPRSVTLYLRPLKKRWRWDKRKRRKTKKSG